MSCCILIQFTIHICQACFTDIHDFPNKSEVTLNYMGEIDHKLNTTVHNKATNSAQIRAI